MSGVITTGSFAKALWPGIKQWFGESYEEYPLLWPQMFERETSTKQYEEYVQSVGTGLMPVKPEGESTDYDTRSQGFVTRVTNVAYSLGIIITREAIADDQYDVIAPPKAKSLGFSARVTQETVAANVYNRWFSSSYVGADGVAGGSTAHPNISGGTFSNILSPAADLSEVSLEDICILIQQATDDRGRRIQLMPDTLIVAPAEGFNATRIMKSVLQNNTGNNAINAIRSMGLFGGGENLVINPYLTDADAWFVRAKGGIEAGMIGQVREEPEFAIDNDFDTSNAKFKCYFRMAWSWADPRGLWASAGA